MLGKYVWELHNNLDKLWVQLLSSRYNSITCILEVNNYHGTSYTWCSIAKAVEALKSCFVTIVGRENISIWYDKWLPNGGICDIVPSIDEHDTYLHIIDVCNCGTWNFDIISTHFP